MPTVKEVLTKSHREDLLGLHKILGVASLVSFAYRLYHVDSDGVFGPGWSTPLTLLLHLSLSASSFFFRIPKKRIKMGYRIWPEARLHAFVFVLRSVAFMTVIWVEQRYGYSDEPFRAAGTLILLSSCGLADLASRCVGKENRSSTIRDLEIGESVKLFFSLAQIHGSAHFVVGVRRYFSYFSFITLIQQNAFLMTLTRRNVASHTTMVLLYGLMLAAYFCMSMWNAARSGHLGVIMSLGNVAAILRMGLGMDKYLLWTSMGICHCLLREEYGRDYHLQNRIWHPLLCVSSLAVVVGGYYKAKAARKKSE